MSEYFYISHKSIVRVKFSILPSILGPGPVHNLQLIMAVLMLYGVDYEYT
jgi:hypothetical protein